METETLYKQVQGIIFQCAILWFHIPESYFSKLYWRQRTFKHSNPYFLLKKQLSVWHFFHFEQNVLKLN